MAKGVMFSVYIYIYIYTHTHTHTQTHSHNIYETWQITALQVTYWLIHTHTRHLAVMQLFAVIHHFHCFRICVVIFRVTFLTCPLQGCRRHARWFSVPISSPALRFTILHYRFDSIVPGVRRSTPFPIRGIVLLICERNFRISALCSILIQVM